VSVSTVSVYLKSGERDPLVHADNHQGEHTLLPFARVVKPSNCLIKTTRNEHRCPHNNPLELGRQTLSQQMLEAKMRVKMSERKARGATWGDCQFLNGGRVVAGSLISPSSLDRLDWCD